MKNFNFAVGALALSSIAFPSLGCTADVYTPRGAAYVGPGVVAEDDVEYGAPPVDIESAPRVEYGGGYAYYSGGHWYRQTPRGWGYYRNEPAELSRQRSVVQQAPAARPAYRAAPGYHASPNVAPPAHREEHHEDRR